MSFHRILSIHGTPRSGTTWLGQILNSSPLVRYKFQPFYSYAFRGRIDLINCERDGLLDFFAQLYNCDDAYIDRKEQIKNGISPSFQKDEIQTILALKEVRFHFLIPHLLEHLENISFVAVVRHPCGALNSWRKAPREFRPEWDFKDEWTFAQSRNQFRPGEYYGFHRWKEATKLFLEMEAKFPERFLLARYEDLVCEPEREVQRIFDFSRLELTDQTRNFLKESRAVHHEDVYSVYKGKQDVDIWKKELDSHIIEAVSKELKGTEFERFLAETAPIPQKINGVAA